MAANARTSTIPAVFGNRTYGIYDVGDNAGWVNLGISHDTAEFAVESIRRWWYDLGKTRYPQPKQR
jgi:hypothetical protein